MDKVFKILHATLQGAFTDITINKFIAKEFGLNSSVLLMFLMKKTFANGFEQALILSRKEIEDGTTLSPKVQLNALQVLVKNKLVRYRVEGMPAVTHYYFTETEIDNFIAILKKYNS